MLGDGSEVDAPDMAEDFPPAVDMDDRDDGGMSPPDMDDGEVPQDMREDVPPPVERWQGLLFTRATPSSNPDAPTSFFVPVEFDPSQSNTSALERAGFPPVCGTNTSDDWANSVPDEVWSITGDVGIETSRLRSIRLLDGSDPTAIPVPYQVMFAEVAGAATSTLHNTSIEITDIRPRDVCETAEIVGRCLVPEFGDFCATYQRFGPADELLIERATSAQDLSMATDAVADVFDGGNGALRPPYTLEATGRVDSADFDIASGLGFRWSVRLDPKSITNTPDEGGFGWVSSTDGTNVIGPATVELLRAGPTIDTDWEELMLDGAIIDFRLGAREFAPGTTYAYELDLFIQTFRPDTFVQTPSLTLWGSVPSTRTFKGF